jgi:hypothetical protein
VVASAHDHSPISGSAPVALDAVGLRRAIRTPVSCRSGTDVLVTDRAEMAQRQADVGSMLYWPAREGRSVYRRANAEAV